MNTVEALNAFKTIHRIGDVGGRMEQAARKLSLAMEAMRHQLKEIHPNWHPEAASQIIEFVSHRSHAIADAKIEFDNACRAYHDAMQKVMEEWQA